MQVFSWNGGSYQFHYTNENKWMNQIIASFPHRIDYGMSSTERLYEYISARAYGEHEVRLNLRQIVAQNTVKPRFKRKIRQLDFIS